MFYTGLDPVVAGLVESLAKPGGRLTGVCSLSRELTVKRVEILKEMIPRLARVVTFSTGRETAGPGREAARQFGVQLVERHVSSVEELRLGLRSLKPREVDAYLHTPDVMVTPHAQLIIEAARVKRLPTMFHEQGLVVKGALASYGASYLEIGRVSAKHVQPRILAGTSPKNLPVENYDKVGLALNLRTARELGLTFPPSLLRRADTVIE